MLISGFSSFFPFGDFKPSSGGPSQAKPSDDPYAVNLNFEEQPDTVSKRANRLLTRLVNTKKGDLLWQLKLSVLENVKPIPWRLRGAISADPIAHCDEIESLLKNPHFNPNPLIKFATTNPELVISKSIAKDPRINLDKLIAAIKERLGVLETSPNSNLAQGLILNPNLRFQDLAGTIKRDEGTAFNFCVAQNLHISKEMLIAMFLETHDDKLEEGLSTRNDLNEKDIRKLYESGFKSNVQTQINYAKNPSAQILVKLLDLVSKDPNSPFAAFVALRADIDIEKLKEISKDLPEDSKFNFYLKYNPQLEPSQDTIDNELKKTRYPSMSSLAETLAKNPQLKLSQIKEIMRNQGNANLCYWLAQDPRINPIEFQAEVTKNPDNNLARGLALNPNLRISSFMDLIEKYPNSLFTDHVRINKKALFNHFVESNGLGKDLILAQRGVVKKDACLFSRVHDSIFQTAA